MKLDPCLGVALDEVPHLDALDGFHRLPADPVAGCLVVDELECTKRHPICVELTSHHSPYPGKLHHVQPRRSGVAEEPLPVLLSRQIRRPGAATGTVAREPEVRRVPGIYGPN